MAFNKKFFTTGGIVASTPSVAAFDPLQNFETVTYTGNGGTQKITGYIRKGAAFNGSSSFIDTNFTLPADSTMSFSFWVNVASLGSGDTYIMSDLSSSAVDRRLDFRFRGSTGGQLYIDVGNGSSDFTTGNTSFVPTLNTWHHIVVTLNGTAINVYVDNGSPISLTSSVAFGTVGARSLSLGRAGDYTSASTHLNGKIDQFRIFNTELDSSKVGQLKDEEYGDAENSVTDFFGDGSGVALYQLDENANDTGGGFDGTGKSAYFDGSSYVQTSLDLDTYDETWSISAWVRFNFNSSYRGIMGSVNSSALNGFVVDIGTSGELRFRLRNNSTSVSALASTSTYGDGDWHHIVAVKGSSTNYLYIDGNAETLSTSTTNGISHAIGIRFGDIGNGTNLKGNLDDIRVYDDELGASEALSIYNGTSIPTDNLLAYYKFEENATDEQGSFNGTWTGTELYKGSPYNGTPTNINFLGMAFQPDLIWIKNRTDNVGHRIYDVNRGLGGTEYYLDSSATTESLIAGSGGVTDVDFNSFTVGAGNAHNGSGDNIVAWCWKAAGAANTYNVLEGGTVTSDSTASGAGITAGTITTGWEVSANRDAGFSIVKYAGQIATGQSGVDTVGHGLSAEPELVIIKSLDLVGLWWAVYHKDISQSGKYLRLNEPSAELTPSNSNDIWGNGMTSDVIGIGDSGGVNRDTSDYIAYCFHSVDGYQKVGSYTGTGAVNNQVNVGFRPRFVMQKRTNSPGGSWNIIDNLRGDDNYLSANLLNDEGSMTASSFHLTDTGFTLDNSFSEWNASGGTYIYLAIA